MMAIPTWKLQSPLPAGECSCLRCHELVRQEDYHTQHRKGRARPVGTPGRHVRRVLCACGCFAVGFYFIFDAEKVRPRDTSSLLCLPAVNWRDSFGGPLNGVA